MGFFTEVRVVLIVTGTWLNGSRTRLLVDYLTRDTLGFCQGQTERPEVFRTLTRHARLARARTESRAAKEIGIIDSPTAE